MKIHLGCGKRYIPGYIHIDAVPFPHVQHVSVIDNLPFINDESVDVIYNCHVLEHFQKNKVHTVLKEWHRILKKGGILRIAVPDFEALSNLYQKTGDLSLVIGSLYGRQDYLYNFHYMVFDFKTLSKVLKDVGFTNIERYDWRKIDHKNIDDYSQSYYPHMDKENGILLSLNVECTKI